MSLSTPAQIRADYLVRTCREFVDAVKPGISRDDAASLAYQYAGRIEVGLPESAARSLVSGFETLGVAE
jgi:hypothetical protein